MPRHTLSCKIQRGIFITIRIRCGAGTIKIAIFSIQYRISFGRQSAKHCKFIGHVVPDVPVSILDMIFEKRQSVLLCPRYYGYHFELLSFEY